jgi:pyruvate dehydrogenase complex dehydrogenase (E1) component
LLRRGFRRDVGLLAITSADRLNAGWQAAERARQRGMAGAMSHIERLLAPLSRDKFNQSCQAKELQAVATKAVEEISAPVKSAVERAFKNVKVI